MAGNNATHYNFFVKCCFIPVVQIIQYKILCNEGQMLPYEIIEFKINYNVNKIKLELLQIKQIWIT